MGCLKCLLLWATLDYVSVISFIWENSRVIQFSSVSFSRGIWYFCNEEAGSLVERRKRQDIIRMKYVGVISIESKIETIENLVKDDYLKLAELRI